MIQTCKKRKKKVKPTKRAFNNVATQLPVYLVFLAVAPSLAYVWRSKCVNSASSEQMYTQYQMMMRCG